MAWLSGSRFARKKAQVLPRVPAGATLRAAEKAPVLSGRGPLRVDCGVCDAVLIKGEFDAAEAVIECPSCSAVNRWPPKP